MSSKRQQTWLPCDRSEILKKIQEALEAKFVYSSDVARILAHAFYGSANVLLWGPGGHGKSQMCMEAALSLGFREEEIFVQSFGEGMTEDRLWGGPNMAKLDEVLEFDTERSFLGSDVKVVVFEEILDAPAQALLPLKDVLSRRVFFNGATRVPLNAGVIIACTNKDPREFAGDSNAVQALMERFPLQEEVKWSSYEQQDYERLFTKCNPDAGSSQRTLQPILAHVIAELNERSFVLSPRMALRALEHVANNVSLHRRKRMIVDDIYAIGDVQGMENYTADLRTKIDKVLREGGVEVLLSDIEYRADLLEARVKEFEQRQEPKEESRRKKRRPQDDDTFSEMVDLAADSDKLARELGAIEVGDASLRTWKRSLDGRIQALSKLTSKGR